MDDRDVEDRLERLAENAMKKALGGISELVLQRVNAETSIYRNELRDLFEKGVEKAMRRITKSAVAQVKLVATHAGRQLEETARRVGQLSGQVESQRASFNTFLMETSQIIPRAIEAGVTRAVDQFTAPKP